ncbi:MAG: YciI family protein [Nevskiales bacterium]|nr:YciI family protein [Nevskiales bacterium]
MLYVILGRETAEGSSKRRQARPAHLERLKQLQNEGRLLLAGPLPGVDAADPGTAGYRGSLVVAEFPDLESATAWANADPYRKAGVFERMEVHPFVKVLPA